MSLGSGVGYLEILMGCGVEVGHLKILMSLGSGVGYLEILMGMRVGVGHL